MPKTADHASVSTLPSSRAVGYRFGRHLSTAVPLVVSHCDKAAEGDDELREHCLQVRAAGVCVGYGVDCVGQGGCGQVGNGGTEKCAESGAKKQAQAVWALPPVTVAVDVQVSAIAHSTGGGVPFCHPSTHALSAALAPAYLQALEGFVLRCPHDTRPQLDAVLGAALRYLRYDPNYAGDEDEEGEGEGDEDMSDGGDDEDADGWVNAMGGGMRRGGEQGVVSCGLVQHGR